MANLPNSAARVISVFHTEGHRDQGRELVGTECGGSDSCFLAATIAKWRLSLEVWSYPHTNSEYTLPQPYILSELTLWSPSGICTTVTETYTIAGTRDRCCNIQAGQLKSRGKQYGNQPHILRPLLVRLSHKEAAEHCI